MAEAQHDMMKNELNDLAFENQTLRKDFGECHKLLKETQQQLYQLQVHEKERLEKEMMVSDQI